MTSAASEKRGGGSVKCWVALIDSLFSVSPSRHRGQAARFFVVLAFVVAFLIEREEAVEFHDLTGGAQFERAATDLRGDVDGGALELGGLHLARDRAVPDQFIELRLIGFDEFRNGLGRAAGIGRAHGFMRFLRVLRLVLIRARRLRDIVLAVIRSDHLADVGDRFLRHVDAVGTHIGDEADGLAVDLDAFIEPLREPHRMRGREAELAARFLLHGRGGEGRRRIAPRGLGFDRGDREGRGFQRLLEIFGFLAAADIEARDLLAVGADQARFEGVVARGREVGNQRPIFPGDEFLDFEFAVADETQRHRLHAAGRARARQFAPQNRGEREADEIVERAAREIGIDQRAVDLARILHRLADGLLGDGVEHHALDRLVLEDLLFLQDLEHVPGNGFAFAIRVGREDEAVGAFDGLGDVVEALCGLGVDLPDHVEVVLRVDRAVLRRQVADMPERGQDLVARAEIFVDRLGLGRRFNNDDLHVIPMT